MQNQKRELKVNQEKTKEQIEYEETAKSMKILTVKLRLSQQGVDTSSISRQELDKVARLYDEMDIISGDSRKMISEIQRDSNVEIQKINQKMNDKLTKISKEIDEVVGSLKEKHSQGSLPVPVNIGPIEVVEKETTLEERASELAESILTRSKSKLKDEILEVLKTAQDTDKIVTAFKDLTVGKGVQLPEEIMEKVEMIENIKTSAQKMAEESASIKPGDKPLDRDIPVVTPEIMQKTEVEIARHREEKI